MTSLPPIIVWFRDDLRMSDHPALHAAAETRAGVVCLYVLDEQSHALRPLGGAARWWLAQSLRALAAGLAKAGGQLVLRKGPAAKAVAEVAREAGAGAVYWNEIAQNPHKSVADQVEATLDTIGVRTRQFGGDLLVHPNTIRNKDTRGLRVFTPFWRRVLASGDPPKPLPAPKKLAAGPRLPGDVLENWQLEPTRPDWAGGLRENWQP